jgi:hypothetical protein
MRSLRCSSETEAPAFVANNPDYFRCKRVLVTIFTRLFPQRRLNLVVDQRRPGLRREHRDIRSFLSSFLLRLISPEIHQAIKLGFGYKGAL